MGGTTQINYRADRNLGSVVNPLGNTIESYDYDLAGRLTKKTDSQGKVSTFAYDAANRLVSATDRKGPDIHAFLRCVVGTFLCPRGFVILG